jgi:hypothetical protein
MKKKPNKTSNDSKMKSIDNKIEKYRNQGKDSNFHI